MVKKVLAVVALLVVSSVARADVMIAAHVIQTQPVQMPSVVAFQLDKPVGGCSAGDWVLYQAANADRAKAVFAVVLSAQLSGKNVHVLVNNAVCPQQGVALATYVTLVN